ncbi:MAG: hypothetical protein QME12_00550 [Nanoarchaeota archaeon]|nr:hypothetical protein [Nanoarchaeota archaeon]
MDKEGRYNLLIALDVIGFSIIILGLFLVRFGKSEIMSILGGFVVAAGLALLGITRYVRK